MKHVILILMLATLVSPAASQTPQKPQFEVASIKPNATGRGTLIEMPPNGRLNISSATFKTLMKIAYRVEDYQIIGGPDWIGVDRFDVQARPPEDYQAPPVVPCFAVNCPLTPAQIMMQGLLEDRFRLKTHREKKELPVYELTIGKNGFKLKEVPPPSDSPDPRRMPPLPPPPPPGTSPPTVASALPTPPPGVTMGFPFGLAASGVALGALDLMLQGILGRPVIDKTGIKGFYDIKIVYSREGIPGNGPAPPAVDGAQTASDPRPSIFTALQEELGLKLESAKGPVEVVVIDSVSKPSEN
jgi:uncharacterized protein (TIGR03435 family)